MNIEKLATWELKNMKKALSGSLSNFLNTNKDNKRLEKVKEELKKRRSKRLR